MSNHATLTMTFRQIWSFCHSPPAALGETTSVSDRFFYVSFHIWLFLFPFQLETEEYVSPHTALLSCTKAILCKQTLNVKQMQSTGSELLEHTRVCVWGSFKLLDMEGLFLLLHVGQHVKTSDREMEALLLVICYLKLFILWILMDLECESKEYIKQQPQIHPVFRTVHLIWCEQRVRRTATVLTDSLTHHPHKVCAITKTFHRDKLLVNAFPKERNVFFFLSFLCPANHIITKHYVIIVSKIV